MSSAVPSSTFSEMNLARLNDEASTILAARMRPILVADNDSQAMTTTCFLPFDRPPAPASWPPTKVSSISTSPESRARDVWAITDRSVWSRCHAVEWLIPSDRSRLCDDTPVFVFVICHAARSHRRRSRFAFASTVWDVTVVRRRHAPHHHARGPCGDRPTTPQRGQAAPARNLTAPRNAAASASVRNQSSNSWTFLGKCTPPRGGSVPRSSPQPPIYAP